MSALCTHLGDCSIRPVLRQLHGALRRITRSSTWCTEREMSARTGGRGVSLPVVSASPSDQAPRR